MTRLETLKYITSGPMVYLDSWVILCVNFWLVVWDVFLCFHYGEFPNTNWMMFVRLFFPNHQPDLSSSRLSLSILPPPFLTWFRYRLAAEQGHAVSQWRMGELLESLGVTMCWVIGGGSKSWYMICVNFNDLTVLPHWKWWFILGESSPLMVLIQVSEVF